ncbi:hypothetical protein PGT21_013337 [Puccinia graminis f. sp. tritici]|uniref:Uncharacterized protein n=1 Tax=Puccinia graminis f. sp. tritici TaxID=56615 RepID=A0A5B0N750_PUCGR|nr:hypothetical protein PGTUg99_008150 [Puccinia graminis f. sp. tritici]KAA1083978.1 hypothetical protein PGT21_013337 [Puccinia graminis f. sp. tritici]
MVSWSNLNQWVWADDLPYPPTWPVYTPPDKVTNSSEHYAETIELNSNHTDTLLPGSKYDPESGRLDG